MIGINKGVFFLSIILLFVISMMLIAEDGLIVLSLCASLSAIFMFAFLWYQQKTDFISQWHKPSNVFLIGYFVVAYQFVWDVLLKLKDLTNISVYQVMDETTVINTFGLGAFMLGYFLTKPKKKYSISKKCYYRIDNTIIVVFQYIFFIGWIATVNVLELLSGKSYFEDVGGSMSSNFESLFFDSTLVLVANVIINSRIGDNSKAFFKSIPFFSWVVISLYCIIRLISGDRGPFIFTTILIFYGYVAFSNIKLKLRKILVVGLLFALILNAVGIARKMTLDMSFSDRLITSFTEFSKNDESRFGGRTIFAVTDELAQSSTCTRVAVNAVNNENEEYHHGKYFLFGLLNAIPFMPSFMNNTLGISVTELSSDYYITEKHQGDYTESQMGTSIIADSYLDLGLLGVICIMLLTGIIFKNVDTIICLGQITKTLLIVIALLYASKAVYISRSTILAPIKDIVPIMVLFYSNKFIQIKKKRI